MVSIFLILESFLLLANAACILSEKFLKSCKFLNKFLLNKPLNFNFIILNIFILLYFLLNIFAIDFNSLSFLIIFIC